MVSSWNQLSDVTPHATEQLIEHAHHANLHLQHKRETRDTYGDNKVGNGSKRNWKPPTAMPIGCYRGT